ncbi:MAG: hypothetical protein ACI4C7_00390 [Clostridia bacterium]
MGNTTLLEDEVVLYEGTATSNEYKGSIKIKLTSYKIIVEKEKGFFKKEIELLDTIALEDIKSYNEVAQIKQKGNSVEIQTIGKNITLSFSGMLEARKFTGKAVNAVTGTTLAKRSSDKVKSAFDMIDDTLGLDTRGTIKGILEQGVKGAIINGIKKQKTEDKVAIDKDTENNS